MKEILEKGAFYVGFLMDYSYTDIVRNTTRTGQYFVLVHVKVEVTDMGPAGKRIQTFTMNMVYEWP